MKKLITASSTSSIGLVIAKLSCKKKLNILIARKANNLTINGGWSVQ